MMFTFLRTSLKTILLTLVFLCLCGTSDAFAAPKKKSNANSKETITYVVVKGDSVDKIAKKFEVRTADIARWNNLSDVSKIRIGQKLRLRVLKGSAAASSSKNFSHSGAATSNATVSQEVYYVVKKGDNLGKISRKTGVSIAQLKKNNRTLAKNPDKLRVGQKLVIEVKRIAAGSGVSRGLANNGSLSGGVQLKSGPGYNVRNPKYAYGTPLTCTLIMDAMSAYADKFPKANKFLVGDISKQNGGKLSPHLSHQSGRDVDISYIVKERFVGFQKVNANTLDVAKTWYVLEWFLKSGKVQYIFVEYELQKYFYDYAKAHGYTDAQLKSLIQYPNGKKSYSAIMRHSNGHADHFHVRFVCASSDVHCK